MDFLGVLEGDTEVLEVIPSLKITGRGLVDVENGRFVNLYAI